MCTGAEAGLILAAAGAATNTANNYAATRKQDRIAAQGIRKQGDLQREASRRAGQYLEEFAGSSPAGEQAQSLEGFMNALRQSRSSTEGDLPTVGAANSRFAEDVSAGRQRVGEQAGERAGRLSRIDAPMYQRQREGSQLMRTGADLGELGRQSSAQDFLSKLRVASTRPNPYVGAAGSIMQGVGTAMSLGAGSGANAAAAAPTTAAAAAPSGFGNAAATLSAPSLAAPTTVAQATAPNLMAAQTAHGLSSQGYMDWLRRLKAASGSGF